MEEYVIGNLNNYLEYFVPSKHGGDCVYTNLLKRAKVFKTLEEAQRMADKIGVDVWCYVVDKDGWRHLSKA